MLSRLRFEVSNCHGFKLIVTMWGVLLAYPTTVPLHIGIKKMVGYSKSLINLFKLNENSHFPLKALKKIKAKVAKKPNRQLPGTSIDFLGVTNNGDLDLSRIWFLLIYLPRSSVHFRKGFLKCLFVFNDCMHYVFMRF